MIDTLEISERLHKSGLKQSTAEELSKVLREVTTNELATKDDLKHTEARIIARVVMWTAGIVIGAVGVILSVIISLFVN